MAERKRRCCAIAQEDESKMKYQEAPFNDAPYVHPFRPPSYLTQQLHTLAFAKTTNVHKLLVTAHDVLKTKPGHVGTTEKQEKRNERWL